MTDAQTPASTEDILRQIADIVERQNEAIAGTTLALNTLVTQLSKVPSRKDTFRANAVLLIMIVAAMIFTGATLYNATLANRSAGARNLAEIRATYDCVVPGGSCYVQAQQSGTGAVANILLQIQCKNEADLRAVVPERANNLPVRPGCDK